MASNNREKGKNLEELEIASDFLEEEKSKRMGNSSQVQTFWAGLCYSSSSSYPGRLLCITALFLSPSQMADLWRKSCTIASSNRGIHDSGDGAVCALLAAVCGAVDVGLCEVGVAELRDSVVGVFTDTFDD